MNEIIVLKQLPEIVEQLDLVSKEVSKKVETAMKLVCTEDTVKEVKKTRAELNKEFNELESQRKQVKNAIMDKYNAFEDVYKDKVANLYKQADTDLKAKIDNVEQSLKDEKEAELREFVNQHIGANNLNDVISYEDVGLNVTLSASIKSLKEQALDFINKVAGDISLIKMEEYSDEIYLEYIKNRGNYAQSKLNVLERHKQLEELQKKQAEQEEKQKAEEEVAQKVEKVVEEITVPKPEEVEPIMECTFKVKTTKENLIKIKNYLKELGVEYD